METTKHREMTPESPVVDKRNWTPIVLTAIAVVTALIAAIWWLGTRDGGGPAPEPVSFTFTDDCTLLAERPTSPAFSTEGPGATFYTCELRNPSDPRFAGTEIWSVSSGGGEGILEITNEDGTWVGSWSGTTSFVNQSAIGTGDYEGLQATWSGPGCFSNCDWQGTIEPIPES